MENKNNSTKKRAYIIFVADSKQYRNSKINIDNILNELSMLCDTAGYEVIERYSFIQQKYQLLFEHKQKVDLHYLVPFVHHLHRKLYSHCIA